MSKKYIDKIIKDSISGSKTEVTLRWETLEEKIESSKVIVSSSKSFLSSLLFKIGLPLFVSGIIIFSVFFALNSNKTTNYIHPQNTNYELVSFRKINFIKSNQKISNKKTVLIKKEKNDSITQQPNKTVIITIEQTDIDTIKIK